MMEESLHNGLVSVIRLRGFIRTPFSRKAEAEEGKIFITTQPA